MRIAISGINGFVGNKLNDTLSKTPRDYHIIPIDITSGIDLSDKAQADNIQSFDVFVHLANLSYVPESYKNPELFYKINYLTTLNSLELCRKYNASFIFVSSYVYGSPLYLPVDEQHPITPFNPYAQSKVICESLCEGYNRDFNIPVIIVRPFNIYGVGQKGNLIIPEIINQLKQGKSVIQLKDPTPRRDYINVKDVAEALKICINHKHKSIKKYNLCTGISYSVLELTEHINQALRNKVCFRFNNTDRPNEVNETKGSYAKILNELGWKPKTDLIDGISEIMKYEGL